MSRKEASNTFTDGLIKDLNPINTPNTVLTDCLNGTLITYDGNEYSLQNDRGNYALKNCKLKPNYIPVGIKEYGDILYIVSYNPLDEHVEVGSYPAPETIHDADDLDDLSQDVNSTLATGVVSGRINYSDLVKNNQPLYIFYGASEYGPDEYKLNPGDFYKISNTLSDLSIYEELKYYIFDENRRSYDITDKILDPGQTADDNGFKHVNWDIPGWIAVQPKFAEIVDFNVNVKKIIVPSYGNATVKLTLNFQLNTEDKLYSNNVNSAKNNLKVEFQITAKGKSGTPDYTGSVLTYSLANVIDVKNGSLVFYSNDWSFNSLVAANYDELTITATPYVEAKPGIKVYYETFGKTLLFNLNQKGLVSDFQIGTSHWWYNTDSSEKLFNLAFDTKGLANSSVLDQDVYLFYSIKRLNGNFVTDTSGNNYDKVLCASWNLIGETNLEFPLTEFTSANYTSNPSRFYAEDFYVMTFDFYDVESPDQNTQPLRTGISKLITASELMNNQQVALYDTVPFDVWIKKYTDSIKDKKITMSKNSNGSVVINNPYIENKAVFEGWKNGNLKSSKYSTLVGQDDYEDLNMDDGFSIVCEATSSVSINYGTSAKLLVGPIWNTLNNSSYAVFESGSFNSGKKFFQQYTGRLNGDFSGTITGFGEKRIPYSLSAISQQVETWEYSYKPLVFSSYKTCLTSRYNRESTDPEGWPVLGWGSGYLYIDAIPSANISKCTVPGSHRGAAKTITQSTEFLSPMANKFPSNDVIFIGLGVGNQSDSNSWSGEALTGVSDIITRTNNSGSTEYAYFAVFKRTSSSVALVRITGSEMTESDAISKLELWTRKLQKLKCDPTTDKVGTFYNSVEGTETVSNNMSLSMDGVITFGSLRYVSGSTSYNLFSTSERNSLVSSLTNMDLSNLNKLEGGDITSFNNCILDKNEEIVDTSLDFSSKDSSINSIKAEIETINTRSQSQLSTYSNDTVLNTYGINAATERYVEVPGQTVGNLFLELLNSRVFDEPTPLMFREWHVNNGYKLEIQKYLGYTSNKYSIS